MSNATKRHRLSSASAHENLCLLRLCVVCRGGVNMSTLGIHEYIVIFFSATCTTRKSARHCDFKSCRPPERMAQMYGSVLKLRKGSGQPSWNEMRASKTGVFNTRWYTFEHKPRAHLCDFWWNRANRYKELKDRSVLWNNVQVKHTAWRTINCSWLQSDRVCTKSVRPAQADLFSPITPSER